MAKRLTDTEKWNDDWYCALSNDYKAVWQWLLDNCSHAGVCKRNIKLVNLMCNVAFTEEEFLETMENRVIVQKNDWFIPKFIKFQYTDLQSNRPVIISVRKELIKKGYHTLIPEEFGDDYRIIPEWLNNDYSIIKDKDKDKDKDKFSQNGANNDNSKNGKAFKSSKAQAEDLWGGRLKETSKKLKSGRKPNS